MIAVGEQQRKRDNHVRYLYVNPGMGEYPPLDPVSARARNRGVASLLTDFATAFVDSARRRELFAVLEDGVGQEALADLVVNRIDYPTISNNLLAFFGFFERDFRIFDYYLGMVEGLSMLASHDRTTTVAERALGVRWLLPEAPQDVPPGLRPLACMLSYLEPTLARYGPVCSGDELLNFRILLQVTLDRVRAACDQLPAAAEQGLARYCEERAAVITGPRVVGVPALAEEEAKRRADETDLDYLLRMLAAYRFKFNDLGLSRSEADYGVVYVRRTLLKMVQGLAEEQPTSLQEVGVLTMGRAVVNDLYYEPPEGWMYITAGSVLEFGASLQPFERAASWLRFNLAVQVKDLQSIITTKPITLSLTPAVGPELGVLFLSNPVVQTLIGVRFGVQWGFADRFGFRSCNEQATRGDGRACSQLLLQHYWAVTLVERLRVQLTMEWFPGPVEVEKDSRFAAQLGFGLQIF